MKYQIGDEVAYMGNKWVVKNESNGLVTITRNGVSRPVKRDKIELIARASE